LDETTSTMIVAGRVEAVYLDCICKDEESRFGTAVQVSQKGFKVKGSERKGVTAYFDVGRILAYNEELTALRQALPERVFTENAFKGNGRYQLACYDVNGNRWTNYPRRTEQLLLLLDAVQIIERLNLSAAETKPASIGNFVVM